MQLLTTKEVCNLLRIHPNTLATWKKLAKFPQAIKVGNIKGKKLWLLSDIEKFINQK